MAETQNLKTHQEMWGNFVRLIVTSCLGIAATLILMAIFLL